jgi:DNA-directed RNA polymerase subunit RPC12/RpoP
MTVIIIVVAVAVALLASIAWRMRRARPSDEPTMYLYRCTDCGQKIRYAASRAGREALCPRCRSRCTLPTTPQPLPPLPTAGQVLDSRRGIGLRRAV